MAKKGKRKKKVKSSQTNWGLIVGIVTLGVIGLVALFALSMQGSAPVSLLDYCLENPLNCATQGDSEAAVTVIEVSDFGCGHCRNFHLETQPLLKAEYIETGRVRWVSLPYALRSETTPAANASLCAAEQGAYFEFSEAMFSQSDQLASLTNAGFLEAAAAVDLNMDSLQACVAENRYVADIEANIEAARRAGVSATPTFFINGRKLEGAHPFTTFQRQIDQLLGS